MSDQVKTASLFALVTLLLASQAAAGTISPALQAQIDKLDESAEIKVLVVMQDQPDIANLDKSLRAERATLADRHIEVISTLRDAARISQADLLRSLDGDKSTSGIVGYTPHWIINAVVVRGTVAAIRDIAARPDVKKVEPDIIIELIDPVMTKESPLPRDKNADGFVASGVTAIGADRVWHELGIDGSGTLVANMDSGVDGSHPALSGRWRGNTVSAAQSWFDAGNVGSPSFPYDPVGHGTHVMGTITGATAFDTVGVAPGAEWIATNPLVTQNSLEIAVIAAFEWLADPDGNPATMADVPDVCHNSWGIPTDGNPEPCDMVLWDVIDNCEAAGIVITFSAGNEGPGPATLRFPGNRATTPTNCFTIGSTAAYPPYTVSQFSSRGPSQCGGPYEIKPEIMAPGENIYSSVPGGGYGMMDGTSMAGPHVAGVVALMRQAAPDLDVTTIKEVLLNTAIDQGVPGDDNTYGRGFVDAYAAVIAVLGNAATVTGTVTDDLSGLPIAGAVIQDTRGFTQTTSATDGIYSFTLLGGATTLATSYFGYQTSELAITVPGTGTLNLDINLAVMPPAVVSGTVRGPDGQPLAGATISAQDIPIAPVVSDGTGYYALTLPSGPDAAYDLMALAPNLAYSLVHTGLQGDRTIDFDLPELQSDGFESGGFATFAWQLAGDALWTVGNDQAYEGVMSARSGDISDGESTTLAVDYFVQGDGEFSFWYKVESEQLFDTLKFIVDGVLMETWSGQIDWTLYSLFLPTGQHSFQWTYAKDESASVGQDCGWIDLVSFPGTGVQPTAAITLSDTALSLSMDAGSTASLNLTLGNTGGYQLDYGTTSSEPGKSALPWINVTPATGTVHPGSFKDLTVGFDSNFLWAGIHHADLFVSSNDPDHPDTVITVELTVTPVSAVGDGLPRHLVFEGAVPNPFNPATDIKFSLPRDAAVDLAIYDVSGRLVRNLADGRRTAGDHSEHWNGRDDSGLNVASGVYFARLKVDGETSIKQMALVR